MSEVVKGWYDTSIHNLDSQKRLALPKAVQPLLQDTFVVFAPKIAPKEELPHLIVMPVEQYEAYRARIASRYKGQQLNAIFTLLSRWSETMTLDSNGRISIKPELREYAGLDGNEKVAIVGQGKLLEIWRQNILDEQCLQTLQISSDDIGVEYYTSIDEGVGFYPA